MTPQKSPAVPPPKPTLPPFWKWLTRITAAVALTLFLVPSVYVVRYYAIDKPREDAYAAALHRSPIAHSSLPMSLPYWENIARDVQSSERVDAIHRIGKILAIPYLSVKLPLECLAAKATLADLAAKDSNPAVQAAASEELGKVAQGGAVIRR